MILEILLAATAPAYAKRDEPPTIPKQTWGLWGASASDCRDEYSPNRVKIGVNWIGFYESSGRLIHTTPAGRYPGESLSARIVMGGEGSIWDLDLVIAYDPANRNKLTITVGKDGEDENYVRCN